MKRWLGVLFPLIAGCSSSSSPLPLQDQDAATPPANQDGGAPPPQQDGSAPFDAGTGSDATPPTGDSGKPPPLPDAGSGAAAACSAYASAFCTQLAACSSIGLGASFGDEATCATRVAITCVGILAAPGTAATVAATNTCATTIPSSSCGPFLAGDLGASCAVGAGTVAANGACAFDAQCATKFCALAPNAICGTCQPPTAAGANCSNGACSNGTFCDTKNNTCVVSNPADAGAVACDIQQQCDLAHGVACDPVNSKCDDSLNVASPGGTCGLTGGTSTKSVTTCPAGGICPGLGALMLTSTCIAPAGDGQSCDLTNGPGCLAPAVCASGKCSIRDGAACH